MATGVRFAGAGGKRLPPAGDRSFRHGRCLNAVGGCLIQLPASQIITCATCVHGLEKPTALLKIIYIGSFGPLSLIPLQALLDRGMQVAAVAQEADNRSSLKERSIPVVTGIHGSIASIARLHDIPIITLSGFWPRSVEEIASYSPDIIIVSCFALRLPAAVLAIPRMGCFNLHPSLLPAYRGPVPLFWQFRDGVEQFGITLHRVSRQFDAGNIVAQTAMSLPDGVSGQRAGVLLAEAGSELLVRTLSDFEEAKLTGAPQDGRCASYQGFPLPSDYAVSASWSAKRLNNFICATRDRGVPYPCPVEAHVYWLLGVDSWQEYGVSEVVISGNMITIPCARGFVTARFRTD
jgi:methionyl-tRNA formyltransferase